MQDFPRKTASPFITCVIAIGLVLRSFIAPGFMLDKTDGLAIIFCEGPAGAYAAAHPGEHHEHHHGAPADQHKHFTSSCTHWSISSLLVFTAIFEPAMFDAIHSGKYSGYNTPYFQQYSGNTRVIRGPPLALS